MNHEKQSFHKTEEPYEATTDLPRSHPPGFGAYFYLQQAHIILFSEFFTWPTLLMIVGIAFLAQGYVGKDHEAILPGTILVGFGLHFHLVNRMPVWPDHMGVFVLILAWLLLRYQKTGTGMFQEGYFSSCRSSCCSQIEQPVGSASLEERSVPSSACGRSSSTSKGRSFSSSRGSERT